MTVPSDADRARHAGQVMGAFLSADGRTPLNAQEAMSDDHGTYPTTQPGSSDDPAISSPDGTDQPGAPPRDRPPTDRLIGIREIRQLFGLGRTAAYDLTHRPGFPAPVPVSPTRLPLVGQRSSRLHRSAPSREPEPARQLPAPGTAAHPAPGNGASAHYRQGARPPATGGPRDEPDRRTGPSPEAG